MRQVISDVADTIGAELNRAKQRIARGRTELQAAVRKLPADLQNIGKQAAADFAGKFDELSESVDDKGTELVDTLATKYTDALKAVDDEIAEEKEKNKGLVAKAVDAVKGVIKTIMELKDLLLSVLAKAAQAVFLILGDPIGFLRNLVTGVGDGLRLFLRNIGTHLQQGIMSWLLGKATEAGLQLPDKFDTRGVLTLLAGLLGLTWQAIRARIVRRVPEQAVAAAEAAVPLVAEVRRRGVAGMWDDLRERVGDLRKTLLDKVIEYVTPTIVVAGITWIISLFNPASAFIRAVKLIIDIVTFVVTRARQILEFVNAVLDAVIAIARGAVGGVAGLVERALAKSIPVLLGLLASLLGVGGIADRVKKIVQALAKPVGKAVDWVIDKIVGLVKRLWGKRRPAKPKKKPAKPGKKDFQRLLAAGLRDARALVKAGLTVRQIKPKLAGIRRRHKLTRLDIVVEGVKGTEHVAHFVAAVNPELAGPKENIALTREEIRADYGILSANQSEFQRQADQNELIIEVRPTNPASVRHLEKKKALYKPQAIKVKTINDRDIQLGEPPVIAPAKRGLVGFFLREVPQPRRGLRAEQREAVVERREQREVERRKYGDTMRKLGQGRRGPGRYDVKDYVVFGYDEHGRRWPLAGDHDLYDIRFADGSEMSDAEYDEFIQDLIDREIGVMHGAVVRWKTKNEDEEKDRQKLLKQHTRAGGEGLVRFAPGQPVRFAYAETPLSRRRS
ncbi:hypothetical protein [Amycolatopsis vancoresmycina]|nr:hypothetical protein [Amycolatopsis vancoresmycina]